MNEMYVLFNPREYTFGLLDEELYGFWKEDFGYVQLEEATIYTDVDVVSFKYLPTGCIWVKLPTKLTGE